MKWWGPRGVTCIAADIDLRVGGHYRLGNALPDGTVLWITGRFEVIERPNLLVYTWTVETKTESDERVTVRFDEIDCNGTMLSLTHERIPTDALRDQHQTGWIGCLDGLAEHLVKGRMTASKQH